MAQHNPLSVHADPLASKKEAWSGRFSEPMAEFVLRYTASVNFDKRMAEADIAGSRCVEETGERAIQAAAQTQKRTRPQSFPPAPTSSSELFRNRGKFLYKKEVSIELLIMC